MYDAWSSGEPGPRLGAGRLLGPLRAAAIGATDPTTARSPPPRGNRTSTRAPASAPLQCEQDTFLRELAILSAVDIFICVAYARVMCWGHRALRLFDQQRLLQTCKLVMCLAVLSWCVPVLVPPLHP
eukprot:COSAG01_NODE_7968_length_2971_cov_1.972493_2_plen_127_part_00